MGEPHREAWIFPGQGSQTVGMGRALAEEHAVVRETFEEADVLLGIPLRALMFEGPLDELTQTRNAQPALLAHGVAVARVLAEEGRRPWIAAGHSLGEFSALVLAGAFSFEVGLRVVRRRGELMDAAGEARRGTMAAIIGLSDTEVQAICAEASDPQVVRGPGEVVVPANLNAPGQVVISGDGAAVTRAGELARARGAKRVIPLKVSGAFHSPLMAPAAEGFREVLEEIAIEDARLPVVSNVTAEPVTEAGEIRRQLVAQLTSPVRWSDCMARMVGLGCTEFVECGPGRVLSALARRVPGVRSAVPVGEPADLAATVRNGTA